VTNPVIPDDVRELINNYSPRIQTIVGELHNHLCGLGCLSYIKTIYIGYEIGGEMVAALYPYHKHVDVALAIPESLTDPILVDASHLTWRSLPLLAVVRTKKDITKAKKFAKLATEQIRSGAHTVHRDNDFFIRTKKERKAKRNALRKIDS